MADDPLELRGRGIDINFGGDPDIGTTEGVVEGMFVDVLVLGRERRYHPPA